jgi:NitT/TauT family transport system substrate-binding protein
MQPKAVLRRWLGAILLIVAAGAAPAWAEIGEVRIGFQFGFIYLPISVAANAGLVQARAKELGIPDLKVTTRIISGTPAINEALISGTIDLGALGLPGVLIGWDKTRGELKALAAMPPPAFVLYSNKPEIKSRAVFKADDRIALPAPVSGQGIFLRMGMEQVFGPGEYKRADTLMVSLPHPDAVAALTSGKVVSGYFASPPFSQMLAKNPAVHVVSTSKQILGGTEVSGAGLVASQRFIDANPNVARAVLLGIEDANRLIRERPREAAEIFIKTESSKMPIEDVVAILGDGSHVWQIEPQGIEKLAAFMAKTGMLKTAPASWKEVFFPLLHDRNGS